MAPSRERGPAGSGGGGGRGCLALVRPLPGPWLPDALPPHLPARVTAPARPQPTAGPPLRRGSSSRTAPRLAPPAWRARRAPGGRRVSPRTPSVARGVPGNAGSRPSPAPPRPCLWELSGGARGLARRPAGPRHCHQPRAAAVTPRSRLCPPPRVGTWPHDGRGVCGAAPSLTLGGPASRVLGPIGDRLCRWNRRVRGGVLPRSTAT